MDKRGKKIITALLYLVPVLFFVVSYFVIVTSGEDIWQGANSQIDIINDSIAAFKHSVRLADMYAWSVINVFDYIFSFGPDIIFRIIDVIAAGSIIYMATYIALQRRPRFCLRDASVFSLIFLMIFLTSNGLTLYAGFSKIHNYLFITFFTALFGIVYLRDLWGRKMPEKWWFATFMMLLGFVFGFASNVTAIVFIITVFVYGIFRFVGSRSSRQSRADFYQSLKRFFLSWRFAGIMGILAAILLMYAVGNGLGDYETSEVYRTTMDYLSFKDIWLDIPGAVLRIVKHNVYNFGRFILPFIVMSLPVTGMIILGRKAQKKKSSIFSFNDKKYLFAVLAFIIIHIIAMSQIYYPTRLVLPAFILAVAVFIWVARKLISVYTADFWNHQKGFINLSVIALVFASLITLGLRTFFAVSYVAKSIPILERIKNSEEQVVCVEWSEIKSPSLPYIHMGQEEFLVDWAMPQTIYDKTIVECQKSQPD
ncbi:hypothetical protein IJG79_01065 [Candidatus Saccharibacteria bacterium]|nr:hypothetical protein [Candidatus Saccharibacteria bacterium]